MPDTCKCTPAEQSGLDGIRSHIGAAALHWHRYSVDLAMITAGVAFAITVFALAQDRTSSLRFVLAGTNALIGVLGYFVLSAIAKQFRTHTSILKRIDDLTGVFCPHHYSSEQTAALYPDLWKNSGGKDGLISTALWIAAGVPIMLAAFLALATWQGWAVKVAA